MVMLMDIVFCVDYTSSMISYFGRIRAIITSISAMVLGMQGNVRIGLIKFRSSYDTWNTNVYEFTGNINVLRQWLGIDEPGGVSPDGYEAVGDALNEALDIGWRANDDNQACHEKLVILFTDGAPNGLSTPLVGADPWIVSNRFREQHIILIVVGVGGGTVECDDFYCALAKNTGGQYIPMVNFEKIFSKVINSVINEGNTVRKAFLHLSIKEIVQNSSFKYEYMRDRVNGMINECKSMNDIKKEFFKYK